MTKTPTVSEALIGLGELSAEKARQYSDAYKKIGPIIQTMFPGGGVTLRTPDDIVRFGLFMQMINKLSRYAYNFGSGGHHDSLDDLSVYSQMLRCFDAEVEADTRR